MKSSVQLFKKPDYPANAIYLDLQEGCDGIELIARDKDGMVKYRILSISEKGLQLHQLESIDYCEPIPVSQQNGRTTIAFRKGYEV